MTININQRAIDCLSNFQADWAEAEVHLGFEMGTYPYGPGTGYDEGEMMQNSAVDAYDDCCKDGGSGCL